MKGFHGGKHLGRHAVAQRIKRNIIKKGAPFGINFIRTRAVGIKITLPVPSLLGYFPDCIDLVDNI